MDALRKRLQTWMRNVLQSQQWSAERWAREAGTSATNITRFLSHPDQAIPSAATLEKLAIACGIPPPIGTGKKSFALIPIVDSASIRLIKWPAKTQELRKLMDQRVGTLQAPHITTPDAFAIIVSSDRLSVLGIVPGDNLVIEPDAEQTSGCVIAFLKQDGGVDIGILEAGNLSSRSTSLHPTYRIEDVSLIGRAVQHVKKL